MKLDDILKAAEIANKRGCDGDLDFMYRDQETGLLYITQRMFDQYCEDILDPENVCIVPYR
jgi:hypothetical protein